MLKIKNYIKAASLQEAYELNQKKSACVLGGMVWLKMGNRNISTAIDLSGLGLDTIEETQEAFEIGCMTTLRTLEENQALEAYTHGAVKESLRHIVGVQFRNCATVGGSVWGRYGFSDVLTVLLAMDTQVELYHRGRISLEEFISLKKDRDILVRIIIKKTPLHIAYLSQRNTKTDFPVLTCAASVVNGQARTVVGARPYRAVILDDPEGLLDGFAQKTPAQKAEAAEAYAGYASDHVNVAGNMRASGEYRRLLTGVLVKRAWGAIGSQTAIGGQTNENQFLA